MHLLRHSQLLAKLGTLLHRKLPPSWFLNHHYIMAELEHYCNAFVLVQSSIRRWSSPARAFIINYKHMPRYHKKIVYFYCTSKYNTTFFFLRIHDYLSCAHCWYLGCILELGIPVGVSLLKARGSKNGG